MLSLRVLESKLGSPEFLPVELRGKRAALLGLLDLFADRFGDLDRAVFAGFVPGRFEVLGKHTDYAGGHSLLAVLDRGFLVVASRNGLGRVRMVEDSREFEPVEFPVAADLDPRVGSWSNYPMTAVKRAAANLGEGVSSSLK